MTQRQTEKTMSVLGCVGILGEIGNELMSSCRRLREPVARRRLHPPSGFRLVRLPLSLRFQPRRHRVRPRRKRRLSGQQFCVRSPHLVEGYLAVGPESERDDHGEDQGDPAVRRLASGEPRRRLDALGPAPAGHKCGHDDEATGNRASSELTASELRSSGRRREGHGVFTRRSRSR